MHKYMAWDEDQDEEDAREYEGSYADEIASIHAEHQFCGSDPFETLVVSVKDDGAVRRFEVTVDYDPTFSAAEVLP